jgi:SSS family solute:Na+ symporter
VTAFLAAFMSTIDTHLNWGASYIMTDVYQRFIKKNASQRHYMTVTRIVVVGMMAMAAAIVPLVKSVEAAWEFLALIMVGGGMISVARWFWWRINAYTEITALALGLILGLANPFVPECVVLFGFPWPQMPFEIKIAFLTGIVVPVSLLVTFLTPAVPQAKLEAFYRKVRPGGFWGPLPQHIRALPGKVLSPGTLVDILGGIMLCYGISLAIGYAILLRFSKAGICIGIALIGALIVARWYKREVSILQGHGGFTASSGQETE